MKHKLLSLILIAAVSQFSERASATSSGHDKTTLAKPKPKISDPAEIIPRAAGLSEAGVTAVAKTMRGQAQISHDGVTLLELKLVDLLAQDNLNPEAAVSIAAEISRAIETIDLQKQLSFIDMMVALSPEDRRALAAYKRSSLREHLERSR